MLPNSLTRVLPFTLVYSTHLPESDCGTSTLISTLSGFSRQLGLTHLRLKGTPPNLDSDRGFPCGPQRLTLGAPPQPIGGWSTFLRPHIAPSKLGLTGSVTSDRPIRPSDPADPVTGPARRANPPYGSSFRSDPHPRCAGSWYGFLFSIHKFFTDSKSQ
jgi:hypothetical protein